MRWKLAAGVVVAVCGVCLFGAAASKELRVRRLVVEDDRGRSRIVMNCSGDTPSISLYDKAGQSRVTFAVYDTGDPVISLYDKDGARRLQANVFPDGEPAFALNGEDAKFSVKLSVSGKGTPEVRLTGVKGERVISLP